MASYNFVSVYKHKTINLKCDKEIVDSNEIVEQIGCDFCLREIPCKCSLQSNTHHYVGHLLGCRENVTTLKTFYPVNLGLLANFFNTSYLQTLVINNYSFLETI